MLLLKPVTTCESAMEKVIGSILIILFVCEGVCPQRHKQRAYMVMAISKLVMLNPANLI